MANTVASEQVVDALMQLRRALSRVEEASATVNRGPGGREISLARTALQEAGHWLKDAKEILDVTVVIPE